MHNRLSRPQQLRRQIEGWITFSPKVAGSNPDVGIAESPKSKLACVPDDFSLQLSDMMVSLQSLDYLPDVK